MPSPGRPGAGEGADLKRTLAVLERRPRKKPRLQVTSRAAKFSKGEFRKCIEV